MELLETKARSVCIDNKYTKQLTPYSIKRLLSSDADPAMLADYIIALLKHDKENDELKELCVSQLDDFLQQGMHILQQTLLTL